MHTYTHVSMFVHAALAFSALGRASAPMVWAHSSGSMRRNADIILY